MLSALNPPRQAHLLSVLIVSGVMTTLAERMHEVLEAIGGNQAELARIAGVSPAAVTLWLDGTTKTLSYRNAVRIEDRLGFLVRWLIEGKTPVRRLPERADLPDEAIEVVRVRVPVVGTAQLGDDGYWHEFEYPTGHGDGFVLHATKDRNAYALRVKGDSMRPRYRHGEFVVVEPNTPVHPGQECAVRLRDGRVMVKIMDWMREGVVQFSSVNEAHRPMTFDVNAVDFIHRVVGNVQGSLFHRES